MRPRASRKRGDFGSQNSITGISANGSRPPIQKITGQPKCGSNCAINWPPRKPPNGLPVKITMMIGARSRSGR